MKYVNATAAQANAWRNLKQREKAFFLSPLSEPVLPGYRPCAGDSDGRGQFWFSDMPRGSGPRSLGEYNKWSHVFPNAGFTWKDLIGVREPWSYPFKGDGPILYRADGPEFHDRKTRRHQCGAGAPWQPAATLPDEHVRLVLVCAYAKPQQVDGVWQANVAVMPLPPRNTAAEAKYAAQWAAFCATYDESERIACQALMDSLQETIALAPDDPRWPEFTKTLPGYDEFWAGYAELCHAQMAGA